MTKIDKLKADLIDIIGERKTVKIKELSHLARSTQLIDELMDKKPQAVTQGDILSGLTKERRNYIKMNQTMQLKPKHREMVANHLLSGRTITQAKFCDMVNQYGLAFALRYEMEKVS